MSPSLISTVALVAAALLYLQRWRALVARKSARISGKQLAAFLMGLVALWGAVASPLAHADQSTLTAHMVQHLLLMTVAAPLLLGGEPLWVLGESLRKHLGAWMLRARSGSSHASQLGAILCWVAGTGVVLLWHIPRLFELGMQWHGLQQASFLAGGLLFWLPVIRPWPVRLSWPRWATPAYLFLATFPCDALSAFLTFCGRAVYPRYCGPQLQSMDLALADQTTAGAMMWFWVTIAYLVPAGVVVIELLSPRRSALALLPHRPLRAEGRAETMDVVEAHR